MVSSEGHHQSKDPRLRAKAPVRQDSTFDDQTEFGQDTVGTLSEAFACFASSAVAAGRTRHKCEDLQNQLAAASAEKERLLKTMKGHAVILQQTEERKQKLESKLAAFRERLSAECALRNEWASKLSAVVIRLCDEKLQVQHVHVADIKLAEDAARMAQGEAAKARDAAELLQKRVAQVEDDVKPAIASAEELRDFLEHNPSLGQKVSDLKKSYMDLSQEVRQDRTQIESYATLAEQVQRQTEEIRGLREMVRSIKDGSSLTADPSLGTIPSEISALRLEIAALRDGGMAGLSQRVDRLDEKMEGISQSTTETPQMPSLNEYVRVYNAFRDRTEQKLRGIEMTLQGLADGQKEDRERCVRDLTEQRRQIDANNDVRDDVLTEDITKLEDRYQNVVEPALQRAAALDEDVRALQSDLAIMKKTSPPQLPRPQLPTFAQLSSEDRTRIDDVKQQVESLSQTVQDLKVSTLRNDHSIWSLNNRYTNLTSEQLCRQMLDVLQPYPVGVHQQLAKFDGTVKELQTKYDECHEIHNKNAETDTDHAQRIGQLEASVHKHGALLQELKQEHTAIVGHVDELRAAHKAYRLSNENVEALQRMILPDADSARQSETRSERRTEAASSAEPLVLSANQDTALLSQYVQSEPASRSRTMNGDIASQGTDKTGTPHSGVPGRTTETTDPKPSLNGQNGKKRKRTVDGESHQQQEVEEDDDDDDDIQTSVSKRRGRR